MSRVRIVIPILLSSLAGPAFGDYSTSYCRSSIDASPRCEAERAREFAAARNAEIEASLAAVRRHRAELALALTHCKTPDSTTPRCLAEREREFAAARNAEIDASLAAVAKARALDLARTHCKTADSMTPRCEAERARAFAAARNAEINASLAAVENERARAFAAARNAEARASLAAYYAERERAFVAAQNAQINASMAMVEFVRQRNAEIKASLAAAKAAREKEFADARNAEINASLAAVKAERERAFAAARNAEINASIAAVETARSQAVAWNAMRCNGVGTTPSCLAAYERKLAESRNIQLADAHEDMKSVDQRSFEAARNAEINASLAAYYAERALRLAMEKRHNDAGLETGAIPVPGPVQEERHSALRRTLYMDPCQDARGPIGPLQFASASSTITYGMKPALDRIAEMAKACPAVRIEIHGHSDASAPAQINRNLAERRAQATLNYLVAAGVERSRLTVYSHGAREPRSDNATDIKNARVEFTVDDPALHSVAMDVMRDLAQLLDPDYTPVVARLSR